MSETKHHSTENDSPRLFMLRPDLRNALFAFLSIPPFVFNCLLLVRLVKTIIQFHSEEVDAMYTYIVSGTALLITSVFSPFVSLLRIYHGRIRMSSTKTTWLKLFALHNPWRKNKNAAREKLFRVFDSAGRYAEGERVYWDDIPKLNEEDKLIAREFVEQGITLNGNDTGIAETSVWLLVFSHLVLSGAIMLAGRYAALVVLEEGFKNDFEVGKELGEWLANYVLLFVGFLQVISRSGWLEALRGVCVGPLSTMTNYERDGLVALYIAMANDTVYGLKRERSYSKLWMNGIVWSAPKVRSTVLIALDESFVVDNSGERPEIRWGLQAETVEVRTVGCE